MTDLYLKREIEKLGVGTKHEYALMLILRKLKKNQDQKEVENINEILNELNTEELNKVFNKLHGIDLVDRGLAASKELYSIMKPKYLNIINTAVESKSRSIYIELEKIIDGKYSFYNISRINKVEAGFSDHYWNNFGIDIEFRGSCSCCSNVFRTASFRYTLDEGDFEKSYAGLETMIKERKELMSKTVKECLPFIIKQLELMKTGDSIKRYKIEGLSLVGAYNWPHIYRELNKKLESLNIGKIIKRGGHIRVLKL